ncbi:MAG: T9SS type A sorting domain-containing protein [Bacteroidota bacterium]|nr:MAG: T9SS type A sorting domain-containing protein [Bacteroidota bacterium]
MKSKLLFLALACSIVSANWVLAQKPDPIDTYMQQSATASVSAVPNPPTNLIGTGKQVGGQSSSPYDIKFTWTDNATNETGYVFQRFFTGIYWNFGCETGPNITVKDHTLSFLPQVTEQFRLFSYTGEKRNRSPYAICVVEMLRADLSLSNVTISKTTANAGETITATCQVNNIGTYGANSSTLKIYIVTASGDIELASIPIQALAVGANSGIKNSTITIPSNLMGNNIIRFVADANNSVLELPASNNTMDKSITIINKDLTIISPKISKSTINGSEVVVASCSVKNIGTQAAPASTLKYYISTTSNGTTTELNSSSVGSLAAGATSSHSANISIPSTYPDGEYYIVFYANATGAFPENTSNNISSVKINYIGPKPDLAFSSNPDFNNVLNDAQGVPMVPINTNVQIKNYVKNNGPGLMNDYWDIDFLFSTNTTYEAASDIVMGGSTHSPIGNVNATQEVIDNLAIPEYGNNGTKLPLTYYYILGILDLLDYVTEQNANNNIIYTKVLLYDPFKTAPQLKAAKDENEGIVAYPNPSKGLYTIEFDNPEFYQLTVSNLLGQIIISKNLDENSYKTEIDLSLFENGQYILRLFGKESGKSLIIVKQ